MSAMLDLGMRLAGIPDAEIDLLNAEAPDAAAFVRLAKQLMPLVKQAQPHVEALLPIVQKAEPIVAQMLPLIERLTPAAQGLTDYLNQGANK